jgi:hypothetical protein
MPRLSEKDTKNIVDPATGRSDDVSQGPRQRSVEFNRTQTLPRMLTSTLVDVLEAITDEDQVWTRELLEQLGEVDDKGPDGITMNIFGILTAIYHD